MESPTSAGMAVTDNIPDIKALPLTPETEGFMRRDAYSVPPRNDWDNSDVLALFATIDAFRSELDAREQALSAVLRLDSDEWRTEMLLPYSNPRSRAHAEIAFENMGKAIRAAIKPFGAQTELLVQEATTAWGSDTKEPRPDATHRVTDAMAHVFWMAYKGTPPAALPDYEIAAIKHGLEAALAAHTEHEEKPQ